MLLQLFLKYLVLGTSVLCSQYFLSQTSVSDNLDRRNLNCLQNVNSENIRANTFNSLVPNTNFVNYDLNSQTTTYEIFDKNYYDIHDIGSCLGTIGNEAFSLNNRNIIGNDDRTRLQILKQILIQQQLC